MRKLAILVLAVIAPLVCSQGNHLIQRAVAQSAPPAAPPPQQLMTPDQALAIDVAQALLAKAQYQALSQQLQARAETLQKRVAELEAEIAKLRRPPAAAPVPSPLPTAPLDPT
jgi:hypothetical protein